MRKIIPAVLATTTLLTAAVLGLPTLPAATQVATPSLEAVAPLDDQHTVFARVLARVVRQDGVDYATLRAERHELDRYRVQLAQTTLPADRAARMALWINAYNALTLTLVIDHLPSQPATWNTWSIRSAGSTFTSVWKSFSYTVAGEHYTLDQLEHELLRPMGDPRIHFAINCASRSCPPLIAEPYRANTLEAQLEQVSQAFASSAEQVRLHGQRVETNPIFEWFGDDFAVAGGAFAWLLARLPAGELHSALAKQGKLRFFAYDWTLNLAQ